MDSAFPSQEEYDHFTAQAAIEARRNPQHYDGFPGNIWHRFESIIKYMPVRDVRMDRQGQYLETAFFFM